MNTQNLGLVHSGAGEHDRALDLLGESVALAREDGDPALVSSTLRPLARALLVGSRTPERAIELLREGLALSVELDERPGILECLETFAAVVEPRAGAELIGAAEAARDAAGASRQPDEQAWVVETKAALRARLGEADYDAAAGAGRVLSLTEAVTRATLRVDPP